MEIILDHWVNSVNKEQSQRVTMWERHGMTIAKVKESGDRFKESSKAAGLKDGKKL